jgi:hypothetical protein
MVQIFCLARKKADHGSNSNMRTRSQIIAQNATEHYYQQRPGCHHNKQAIFTDR